MLDQVRRLCMAVARLFMPAARGVYPPHSGSPVVLGIALPPEDDPDELARHLWWRGLGLVQRDGQTIAGADITAAVRMRRVRHAHRFVTRQLRDAGVRGPVKRWELGGRSRSQRRT
jgi:hypothetical protein